MTGIPVVRYGPGRLPLADGPGALEQGEWPRWFRPGDLGWIPAVRIVGAFEVEDPHGQVIECPDGWLALTPDGHPWPIPVEEFRRYGRWHPEPEE